MKFETVGIHFLSDVLICCHASQREVTTSPLYCYRQKINLGHAHNPDICNCIFFFLYESTFRSHEMCESAHSNRFFFNLLS